MEENPDGMFSVFELDNMSRWKRADFLEAADVADKEVAEMRATAEQPTYQRPIYKTATSFEVVGHEELPMSAAQKEQLLGWAKAIEARAAYLRARATETPE